ncbi:hypothetical protein [Nocardioides sp. MH1]|uniref:hypothetical protein n=1 Tax=Nocardioides sp. MH1 TaxID=3242490 RepID=UPI003520135A
MDVSEIRQRLNIAPQAGIAWFCVDESDVAFAPQKAPGPRRVILRSWPDGTPVACVFARTTTGTSGIPHDAHDHLAEYDRCNIDKEGRIVLGVPLTAKKSVLDHNTSICDEPDADITRRVLTAPGCS